ncbi:hypothetical protein Esti_002870 [Eimeria stiedai]
MLFGEITPKWQAYHIPAFVYREVEKHKKLIKKTTPRLFAYEAQLCKTRRHSCTATMVALLRAAAAAAFAGILGQALVHIDAVEFPPGDPEGHPLGEPVPGENPAATQGVPRLASTEYAPASGMGAGLHAPHELHSRALLEGRLLRLYGLKTFVVGLALLCVLTYLRLKAENGFGINPTIFKGIQPDAEGSEKFKRVTGRLARQAAGPLYDSGSLSSTGQVAAVVLVISGLAEVIASLRRRAKAKQGQAVSHRPPLRATVLVTIGMIAEVLFVLGLLFTNLPVFLGLARLAAIFLIASVALFFGSFVQQYAYRNRRRTALAATAQASQK